MGEFGRGGWLCGRDRPPGGPVVETERVREERLQALCGGFGLTVVGSFAPPCGSGAGEWWRDCGSEGGEGLWGDRRTARSDRPMPRLLNIVGDRA